MNGIKPIPFGIFLWKNQIRAVSQVFLKIRFPKNSGVPGLFIRVCKYSDYNGGLNKKSIPLKTTESRREAAEGHRGHILCGSLCLLCGSL